MVKGPKNCHWLSCLRYSRKNLTTEYSTINVTEMAPGLILLVVYCLMNIVRMTMKISTHSKRSARRFVFILGRLSTVVYTYVSASGRRLGATIPYSSWLRKLPKRPRMIPTGTTTNKRSKTIASSFLVSLNILSSTSIASTTPTMPPINDMPPCRTAMISLRCWL